MTAPGGIPIAPRALSDYVQRHGGWVREPTSGHSWRPASSSAPRRALAEEVVRRLAPVDRAGPGEIAPLLSARFAEAAASAVTRGAVLLVDETLASRDDIGRLPGWVHPHANATLAALLDFADAPADDPVIGDECTIGRNVVLMPRVRIGKRVTIGPGAVIGDAGFGWAADAKGVMRAIPQLGGVVIEDDVHIGALCTIASGTLGPTVLRRGAKLDAQVHVGHNCEIGENTIIAAQTGLAGSVIVGRNVMMGGQVGVADHVRIGDGARIAGQSGIIGDVEPGSTVAGYPAVERQRWLRGLAELYRLATTRGGSAPPIASNLAATGYSAYPSPPASSPGGAGSAGPSSSVKPEAIIRRSEPPPSSDER